MSETLTLAGAALERTARGRELVRITAPLPMSKGIQPPGTCARRTRLADSHGTQRSLPSGVLC